MRRRRAACWATTKVPRMLVRCMRSKSSGRGRRAASQQHDARRRSRRRRRRRSASSAGSNSAATATSSATSAATAIARPPAAVISSTTASARGRGCPRSATTTAMPSAASRYGQAWPMPREPPVTMATRSVISISLVVYATSIYHECMNTVHIILRRRGSHDRRATRRGRGRRPADEVRREVLEAAANCSSRREWPRSPSRRSRPLGRQQDDDLQVVAVQGRTGARRLLQQGRTRLAFADTGDIEADLRAQLHAFVRVIRDTPAGRVIGELIGQAQSDPELKAAYLERYSSPRRALAVAAMEQAKQRGQLRATWTPRRSSTSCGAPATTGCCCRTSR